MAKNEQTKKLLSAAEFLDTKDDEFEDVYLPAFKGCVRIRSISGLEAANFIDADTKKRSESIARAVVMSAIDEKGEPIFTLEDIERIKRKSYKTLMILQDAVIRVNGLTKESREASKND
jgi:hypothetical protein